MTTYATGLPTKGFATDIGGPVDVVFLARTAQRLVTLVSGEIFGGTVAPPDDKNGIYRLERDGSFTLVADIGGWLGRQPAEPAFFVEHGAKEYAMEGYHGGFLVTDGHHNRVSAVGAQNALINQVADLREKEHRRRRLEVTRGWVFITQPRPIPHEPEASESCRSASEIATHRELPAGRACLSTSSSEWGGGGKLYALSQGQLGRGWGRARRLFRQTADWSSLSVTEA